MSDEAFPASTPLTFRVRYQSLSAYNRDLKGRGDLTVRGDAFAFTGAERGVPFSSERIERVLQRDQIRNVTSAGTRIEFTTLAGRSGELKKPFVFFCDDAATAKAIVALLPRETDAAHVAARDFGARLNSVARMKGPTEFVTNWIIAANVVAFVIMGFLGAGWFDTASMKPYYLYVANNGAATTDGEWWRLVTAMFAHYGLLHLALNMWALFQAGHLVEKLLGRALFTLMYFGSGIIGSLATLLWHGDKVWSAGASGAVFGVYGALLGYLWREKHGVPRGVLQPLMKSTLTFAGYNLVYGAIHPHIDNMAHIGGLAGGILFGWLSALPLDAETRARETPRRLVLGVGVLAAALLVGIAAAPRYNYNIADELRWEDAIGNHAQQEKSLLAKGNPYLAHAANPAVEAKARSWLEHEAIPFYDQWRTELLKLPLKPGRATAKRREALAALLGLQLHTYRELVAQKNWNDPAFEKHFEAEQQEIVAAVARMKQER